MTPREAASRRVASDRARIAAARKRREEFVRKWRNAHALRSRFSAEDVAEEELRLQAEIAERLAEGMVTKCLTPSLFDA